MSRAWPPTSATVLKAAPVVLCALATPLILECVFSSEGEVDSVQTAFLAKEETKRRSELSLLLKLELSRHPKIRSHVREIMPMCTAAWVDDMAGAAAQAESEGEETGGGQRKLEPQSDDESADESDDSEEDGLDDSMVGQANKLLLMSSQLFQLRPKDSAAVADIHAARLLGMLLLSDELRVVTTLTERATDEKYKSGEVLEGMSTRTEQGALTYESRRNGSTGYNPNGDLAIARVRASIADAKRKLLATWRAAQGEVRRRTRQRYSKVAELIFASSESIPWIVADSALTVVSTGACFNVTVTFCANPPHKFDLPPVIYYILSLKCSCRCVLQRYRYNVMSCASFSQPLTRCSPQHFVIFVSTRRAAVAGLATWFAGRTLNILIAASRGSSKESASTTQQKVSRALLSMLAARAASTLLKQYHLVMQRKGKRQFALRLQVRLFEAILTQDLAWMDAQDDKYKLHRLIWSVPRASQSLLKLPNRVMTIATTTYTSFLLLRTMSSKLGTLSSFNPGVYGWYSTYHRHISCESFSRFDTRYVPRGTPNNLTLVFNR